jgi:hypothetical protein
MGYCAKTRQRESPSVRWCIINKMHGIASEIACVQTKLMHGDTAVRSTGEALVDECEVIIDKNKNRQHDSK